MGNLGAGEILVILLLALLVFGPQRLPEIARNLGKAIKVFQHESQRAANVLKSSLEEQPTPTAPGIVDRPDEPARAVVEASQEARAAAAEQDAEGDRERAVKRELEDT